MGTAYDVAFSSTPGVLAGTRNYAARCSAHWRRDRVIEGKVTETFRREPVLGLSCQGVIVESAAPVEIHDLTMSVYPAL